MNVATGANDTGIYIGQSHDVRIDHNVATDNVSGSITAGMPIREVVAETNSLK